MAAKLRGYGDGRLEAAIATYKKLIPLKPDVMRMGEKSTMSRCPEVNARTSHLAARGERLDAG
jgi:hypothetical protein